MSIEISVITACQSHTYCSFLSSTIKSHKTSIAVFMCEKSLASWTFARPQSQCKTVPANCFERMIGKHSAGGKVSKSDKTFVKQSSTVATVADHLATLAANTSAGP